MLSLAQSSGSVFCIEWIPTESGPKVVKYKKIKASFNCNTYENFLDYILPEFKISSLNDSNSITLSLDIHNVGITSFKYDNQISLTNYIKWYEEIVLGEYIVDNYDIYYRELCNINGIVMGLHISKDLKKNIIDSCTNHNLKIQNLALDIFSANIAINQIYKTKKIKSYIIWKVAKNNAHYVMYFENKDLKHYLKIKKKKNVEIIQHIGDVALQDKLIDFSKSLLLDKTISVPFIDKIYIYQTKSDVSFIKKVLNKSEKIEIMDIGSKFLNKTKKNINYSLIGFNENGNSLKGIDV